MIRPTLPDTFQTTVPGTIRDDPGQIQLAVGERGGPRLRMVESVFDTYAPAKTLRDAVS